MNVLLADTAMPYSTENLFQMLNIEISQATNNFKKTIPKLGKSISTESLVIHNNRNNTLTSRAGTLLRMGLDPDAIERILLDINNTQVMPPLPEKEVKQIAKSIMRYKENNASLEANDNQPSPRLALTDGLIQFSHLDPKPRTYVLQDLIVAVKVCVLAGLGGVSKTMLSMQLAVCVALGLPYMNKKTLEGAVILILGEEDADEISRRFNAIVKFMKLNNEQIELVKVRVRAFPMNGLDARLTKKHIGALEPTDFTAEIITASKELAIEAGMPVRLMILDHAGLIHGGDFNSREDVVQTMRQINFITQETDAATLVLAHSPKTAVGKDKADSNDVAGSAAWVDLARAVFVLRTMDDAEGKKYGIRPEIRKNYASLSIVKNNYGPSDDTYWLKRTLVETHSASVLDHVNLEVPAQILNGNEELLKRILSKITLHPGKYSKRGFIDKYTGDDGYIKASKRAIGRSLDELLQKGDIIIKPVSIELRQQLSLHQTVKETMHPVDA